MVTDHIEHSQNLIVDWTGAGHNVGNIYSTGWYFRTLKSEYSQSLDKEKGNYVINFSIPWFQDILYNTIHKNFRS